MKTVDLVPTWTAALQIVTTLFQDSRNHVRGAKNQALMDERIALLNEVFAPLCTQADKRIAEARAEAEAKEPAQSARDYLDCGHTSADLNADMKCNVCGCDANVPF
jgi:hypothetical protein